MIKLNNSMKQIANKYYETTANTRRVLWVFSGTKPTKAQIQALISNGLIMSNSLKALGTLRLSAVYEPTVQPVMVNKNLQRWPFGGVNADFVVHSPGPAQWFVFMLCSTNINSPNFTTNAEVYQAYIGSAGDIGSGAEMELLTGMVETDRVYKANDIELRVI